MGLNYALLRNLTAREVISALIRDGFALDRGRGSHQIFYHPDGRRVSVTFFAPGQTFTLKTLKSMIETEARWTEEDLKRLKLIH
jgi:predicted RNA binding protein YcfA (HicA-like mRNA interferase family)